MNSSEQDSRRRPLPTRYVGVVLLALFLVVAGVWLARHLDFQNQWDNDEGIVALGGRALLAGQRPYVDFWLDHPPGAAVALALVFRAFGASVLTARTFCLILGLLGVAATAWIARRLAGDVAALATAVLLTLSPHFFWLVRSINRDVPSMALGVLGLGCLWRWRDRGGWASALVAGLCFGLGLSFKLGALLLLAPAGVLVLDRLRRVGRGGVRRTMLEVVVAGVGTMLVVATWFLSAPASAVWQGAFGHYGAARGVFPNRAAEYATWLVTENLLGENLGLVALGAFGFASLCVRRRSDAAVLITWLAATCLAIVLQRPMWPKHHFSLVLWPLSVLAGVGVAALARLVMERAGSHRRALCVAGGVAAVVWLATLPNTFGLLRAEAVIRPFAAGIQGVQWLQTHTSPGDAVLTDNGLLALRADRPMPAAMIALSTKRIQTGGVSDADIIRAADDPPVKAVMLWNDQLTDFKGFLGWLPTRFVRMAKVGDNRQIWQRVDASLAAVPDGSRFGDVARLEAHTVVTATVRPGESVGLRLLWRALGTSTQPLSAFVHLIGPDGQKIAQADGWPGETATTGWRPDTLSLDVRSLKVPKDAPPGIYRFVVGLYDPATGKRVPVIRPDGSSAPGDAIGLEPPVVVSGG